MADVQKKNKSIYFLILVAAIILAAIGFYYYNKRFSAEMVKPKVGPVVEAVYGLGTVIAPRTYQVKSAINQNIVAIYVTEGDQVKAGDRLIQFDESGAKRAPFVGTITAVPFKQGEILFPGVAAITLINLQDLYLEVSLEQQSALRIIKGQKAVVSFETMRNQKMNGQVQSIFPKESQFIVRITLPQFPNGVLPGMTADVAIEVARKENVLSIPVKAISSGKISFRRHDKTMKESVEVGVTDGEWAEVLSNNIQADDEILVRSK